MAEAKRTPVVTCATQGAWRTWLARHPGSPGVWLKLAKKGARVTTLSYAEALDVALCFGWIDGQKAPLDEEAWLQRFTPRAARSKWSRNNRDRAEELLAGGAMQAGGRAAVERAKADGSWDAAYAGQRTATVPDDLRRALDDNPQAAAFFAGLDSANRYAVLYRVGDAKRPETRARRIEKFVAMLARGETLHPAGSRR